jgi:hypothetical protein
MMRRARLLLLLALLCTAPALLAAQADRRAGAAVQRRSQERDATPPALERRARAEQAIREALAQVVRERLNLTDDQAVRLQAVNRRFADDRLRILGDEFRVRRALRRELATGDSMRSPETARLLDQLLDLQRQRLDTQQQEQQALAEFLTPGQRARYLAMMDQLRKRIQARLDSGGRVGQREPF